MLLLKILNIVLCGSSFVSVLDGNSVECVILLNIALVGSKSTHVFLKQPGPDFIICLACKTPLIVSVVKRFRNLVFTQLTVENTLSQSALE